jgi:L-alanine-DL-glutamate epimerase-like enolase superfamily enzyme
MRVELEAVTLRLREPLRTAYGDVAARPLVTLTLTTDDGLAGRGEAAPLPQYDGVELADVLEALELYGPLLERGDDRDRPAVLAACRYEADIPQALAAVDLALWDLAGKRAGKPVAALLSDRPAARVAVNATLGAVDPARAASDALAAVQAGFGTLKLKAGTADDEARVAAVRGAVGPDVALRIDANGAWDAGEALTALRALAPHRLELAEEPVHGLDGLRAVRGRTPVAIAMDETAGAPGALESGAADLVCLKIARHGGITGVLDAAERVRAAGMEPYVASSIDGPAGIAAGLHVAAVLGSERASGLATLAMLDGVRDPFPPRRGSIRVPPRPGLGLD